MMDEELAECLLMWVQTFDVEGEKDSVQGLCDGAALVNILLEVSSNYFSDKLAGVKSDQASNKHIKISNLKKILNAVLTYYDNEIGMRIQESQKPNLKMVVENSNLLEMGRLLQLVLGCAVNCDNKQDYIQTIMGMEESVQHGVMTAIQELMTQDATPSSVENDGVDLATQLANAQRELSDTKQANADLSQRCTELDLQVANLLEEKSHLETTSEAISDHDKTTDDLEDPNTASGKKYLALQQQLEQYKDEVYRLDAAKEDYRNKYEYASKEAADLKEKTDSLTALAEEARGLKDEVDILRQNEEKVKKYESTIESYKRKLEDMTDLRRNVKMLEEKNTSYMEKSVEWEEESKKTSTLKSQIEVYKRQVQELQNKITTETKRADKSEFEIKRFQDKMSSTQKEKDRLAQELQTLKESHEELEFAKLQGLSTDSNPGEDDLELLSLPPALKEKYIRLQTENRMLNKKLKDTENNTATESLLEDAQSRVNELESDARISNQRVMELEAQVEDLQEASQNIAAGQGDASKELRKKLTELTHKSKTLESDLGKKKQHIETADTRIQEFTKIIKEKDEKLQLRENEMKEIEEKYKKYLEKAKAVINKMETSQNADPNVSPQLEMLRGQLLEKEKLVAQIQKESERQKNIRETEEKLMVSAWYNMGMSKHRQAVEERLSQYSNGQSFLARQRQVHSKRAGAPLTPTNR